MNAAERLTATDAAARLASGELSSEELTRACLARIDSRDADVQAWAWIDPEAALSQARACDARVAQGASIGPLHGLPVGVKDIIDTAGIPTERGSPIYQGRIPDSDAGCVANLRAAGAVIMGKTVTTEFASIHPGKTRNPHNPTHTPGGSSSGSAAAVGDFQIPLALATQTGGSVIRPASFCGVYGLKPTLNSISPTGVQCQSHTLDTVGVYGRSVADLALIGDALYTNGDYALRAAARTPTNQNQRLAFIRTPIWNQADSNAQIAMEAFVAGLGSQCEEVTLEKPFERIAELHQTVMSGENSHYYGHYLTDSPDLLSDELRERLVGANAVTVADYVEAMQLRELINKMVDALLNDFDAILCMASAGPAPDSLITTGSPIFNGLWTYLGVPCITLPLLQVNKMPMGVQLVGKRHQDAKLIHAANCLSQQQV